MNPLFINKTYSQEQIKGLLESILFVTGKPVEKEKLCTWLSLSDEELDQLVVTLNQTYEEKYTGFVVIAIANGYQLMTNPLYKEELREIFGSKEENKLSQTAMEILAIIAYKQPVSKEAIDRIRGVNSSRSLNTLLGHKLIDIVGTESLLDEILYGTSKKFLELFRLNSINDLPSPESLELSELTEIFSEVSTQEWTEDLQEEKN